MKWDWRVFYDKVYNWVISMGPRILVAIAILIVGFWLIRLFNRIMKRRMTRLNPSLRYFLQNLIVVFLEILLVLMVMQIVGIQLTVFTAIIAGFSVAAGLALSGTLQNFVSGILILLLKPFRVGDNISTQGQEGTVTAVQLFFTTVLTFDNKTIIIPNGQLSNNVVINLSREGKRRMDIELKFAYGADIEAIKKVLHESIRSAEQVLSEPVTRIGVSKLEADRFTITVNIWTQAHGYYDLLLIMNEKLVTDLKNAGIKFPGM